MAAAAAVTIIMAAVSVFVPGVLTLGESKPTLADLPTDLLAAGPQDEVTSNLLLDFLLGWVLWTSCPHLTWTSCLHKNRNTAAS